MPLILRVPDYLTAFVLAGRFESIMSVSARGAKVTEHKARPESRVGESWGGCGSHYLGCKGKRALFVVAWVGLEHFHSWIHF
jgi:hypothetical protein